jgi:hypothetical protein
VRGGAGGAGSGIDWMPTFSWRLAFSGRIGYSSSSVEAWD